MGRLTSYENGLDREMVCRHEDCHTSEEHCPLINECECWCLQEILEKLAHYEDLEEAGRLIELPCAVGDKAYFITVNAEGEHIIGSGKFSYSWLDYPRLIYATKAEAERKLKELEGVKE